jgi:hypothetical protein
LQRNLRSGLSPSFSQDQSAAKVRTIRRSGRIWERAGGPWGLRDCVEGGAADIPLLIGRIDADDEKIGGGREAAVAGVGGEHGDVADVDGDFVAVFASEHQVRGARDEAEDLVRGRVVVVKVVDAVAPLRRQSVAGEDGLKGRSGIVALALQCAAIEEDGQVLVVGHPAFA